MLSNKFPARLKKVVLLEPPSFFNWAFRIIRPLIPGKYLEKLGTGRCSDLLSYVDVDKLLLEFGGTLMFDANAYIDALAVEEQQQLSQVQQSAVTSIPQELNATPPAPFVKTVEPELSTTGPIEGGAAF